MWVQIVVSYASLILHCNRYATAPVMALRIQKMVWIVYIYPSYPP